MYFTQATYTWFPQIITYLFQGLLRYISRSFQGLFFVLSKDMFLNYLKVDSLSAYTHKAVVKYHNPHNVRIIMIKTSDLNSQNLTTGGEPGKCRYLLGSNWERAETSGSPQKRYIPVSLLLLFTFCGWGGVYPI